MEEKTITEKMVNHLDRIHDDRLPEPVLCYKPKGYRGATGRQSKRWLWSRNRLQPNLWRAEGR